MTLRDAVTTARNNVGQAALEAARCAADASRPSQERLQAFRRVMELEVGNTWLRRSRAIERDFGLPGLFLKFEGDNPTGTQKDRIAFAHLIDALQKGMTDVALATCGNYGVAVALAAKLAGVKCHIFIPASYHTNRLSEMETLGGIIYRPQGTYEDVVTYSSKQAAEREWYDANPGGRNTALQLEGYASLGRELREELCGFPVNCAVPVSNGTLLAGIYQGLGQGAPTRMIAASATAKNPIVFSFREGSEKCLDLDPAKIKETVINEPLINWHSFDGQEALDAVSNSKGAAFNVSDERMRKMARYLSERESLRVLPAATAGLVGLLMMHEAGELSEGNQVAIITAKQ